MSIFYQLTPEDLKANGFKYKGWMFGFVPIYMTEEGGPEGPTVVTRNWVPEWLIDFGHFLFWLCCMMTPNGDYLNVPIYITGEI